LSKAEAEYVSLAGFAQEATRIRKLLNVLCQEQIGPTVACEDYKAGGPIAAKTDIRNRMHAENQ